jgi:hypothetical protein
MARLHLALIPEEEVEFVASHLSDIEAQFADDFDGQLRAPGRGPEWRMVPGVLEQRTYVVYAREMSDSVIELRQLDIT